MTTSWTSSKALARNFTILSLQLATWAYILKLRVRVSRPGETSSLHRKRPRAIPQDQADSSRPEACSTVGKGYGSTPGRLCGPTGFDALAANEELVWGKVSSGLQARPVRYQGGVGAFSGPVVSVEEIPRSDLEESAVVLHRSQHSQFRFRLR